MQRRNTIRPAGLPAPDADSLRAALGRLKRERSPDRALDLAYAYCELGEIFLRHGRPEKAEPHFLRAVALSDKLPRAHLDLGRIYEGKGFKKEADKEFREAGRARAADFKILLEIGDIYCQRGALKRARDFFRRALRASARSDQAYQHIVQVLNSQEMYEESASWLKEAAAANPGIPRIQFQLGWACGKLHKSAEMKDCFRRYLKMEKGGAGNGADRIIARVCLRDFAGAAAEADAALDALGPDDLERISEPWPDCRTHSIPESFYLDQAKVLKRLAGRAPGSPWLSFFLYICLSHTTEHETLELCQKRLEKLPGKRYGWMRFGSARTQLRKGRYKTAVSGFSAVLRSRPDFLKARCLLAEAYLCLAEPRKAFEEFRRAELLAGNSAHFVWGWRGEALLWLGRYDEALEHLDRAVNCGSQMAMCWRGAARLLSGRPEDALRDLDRAISLGYQDAESLIWRAEARHRLGRREEALQDLEKALAFETGDHAWIYLNLSLVKAGLGDLPGMWENYGKIPVEIVDHLKSRLGWGAEMPRSRKDVRRLLEYGRGLARGDRRPESYVRAIWMAAAAKERQRRGRPSAAPSVPVRGICTISE